MSELKKKRKYRHWVNIPLYLFVFCLWVGCETLLLKNIPLLLMCVFVFGTLYLLDMLVQRRFVPPPEPRTWRAAKMGCAQVGIMSAFLLSVLGVMWSCVPPVAISEQTTYVTEPRTATGMEVDTIAAIENRFAPKGKPEENGFRKVVELFGPKQVFNLAPEHREEYAAQLLRQLDWNVPLNNPDAPLVKFQPAYDYYHDYFINQNAKNGGDGHKPGELRNKIYKIESRMSCKPWQADDIEAAAIWLAENSGAMDRFGEAVRMPHYYVPIFMPPGTRVTWERLYEEEHFHRSMVRALSYRMMNSLANGNHDQTFYDTETLLRFSEARMRHVNSTLQFLNACSSQRTAVQAVFQLVKYGHLTKEQLRELDQLFQRHRPVIPISDAVFLVRLEGTHLLYELASGRILESNVAGLAWYQLLPVRLVWNSGKYFAWRDIFTNYQKTIDRLENIAAQPVSRKQFRGLVDWDLADSFLSDLSLKPFLFDLFQKGIYLSVSGLVGKTTLSLAASMISGLGYSYYHGITAIRQAEIAIALEFYRRDHGGYPETLDELQGIYLEEIPDDPFADGEPFRYVPEEHGGEPGYRLYSVGPDGADDGGPNWSCSVCDSCDCDEFPRPTGENDGLFPAKTDDIGIKVGR